MEFFFGNQRKLTGSLSKGLCQSFMPYHFRTVAAVSIFIYMRWFELIRKYIVGLSGTIH